METNPGNPNPSLGDLFTIVLVTYGTIFAIVLGLWCCLLLYRRVTRKRREAENKARMLQLAVRSSIMTVNEARKFWLSSVQPEKVHRDQYPE